MMLLLLWCAVENEGGAMSILPEAEVQTRLANLVEEWQKAEDDCIASCDKMLKATDNVIIQEIVGIIRSDSTRHKEVLTLISQAMEGEVTVEAKELGKMNELIEEHLELERESVSLALKEFETSRNVAVRQLLGYLLEDERKHFMLMTQLIDFERLNPED
jgi:hypothetical protein